MLSTDFTKLKDYEQIKHYHSFRFFQNSLENHEIGGEALEDAWYYFQEGWKAHKEAYEL